MYKIGISYQDVDEILNHEHLADVDCNIVYNTPYRTHRSALKKLLQELHITQSLIDSCGNLEVIEGLYNEDGSLAWGNGVIEHIPPQKRHTKKGA